MIRADFFKDKNDKLLGFHINGHAEYNEYGSDIACSSVSSAVMMAANTITEAFKVDAKVVVDENDILLKLVSDEDGYGDKVLLGLLTHMYNLSDEFTGCINVKVIEK
ncbi:MAG: ribosomal-processing cysteine protease Prp [Ruminococcus sp.]|nr:ribosomal-processing cysteine protease Prp [Ruminococcus sp.]